MTPSALRRSNDPSLLILTSLAQGPKHGYALSKDIEEFAGVVLSPGTLYGAITRLEESRLIEPEAEVDRRRPYRMTAAGSPRIGRSIGGHDSSRRSWYATTSIRSPGGQRETIHR